jgi:hypothetical protein
VSARGRLGLAQTAGRFVWSARQRWQELPPDRRRRLQELLRRSRGRPSALTAAERRELAALVRELELGRLVRDAAASSALGGRGRRRGGR